jgi:hypothetical protein
MMSAPSTRAIEIARPLTEYVCDHVGATFCVALAPTPFTIKPM